MTAKPQANIVAQPQANIIECHGTSFDDDGELMVGFYFEFLDLDGETPISVKYGPYGTAQECEQACQKAFDEDDY